MPGRPKLTANAMHCITISLLSHKSTSVMSSPRSTRSCAPWGAYRTILTGADPEASDDDSAFTTDDMDSMESELLLLDLEDSDQP
jgi:hypothetical protein